MAAAVASVSTNVGGVSDVITNPKVGSLTPFGDAQALSDAVASFAADPDRRVAVGSAAKASVRERFHAARLMDNITGLYWRLLANDGTISEPDAGMTA
jgi:glycosyltransferase involved in cell wall biosynthesis